MVDFTLAKYHPSYQLWYCPSWKYDFLVGVDSPAQILLVLDESGAITESDLGFVGMNRLMMEACISA